MIINNPTMISDILMNILAVACVFLEVHSQDIAKFACQAVSN